MPMIWGDLQNLYADDYMYSGVKISCTWADDLLESVKARFCLVIAMNISL